jgi:hypothetical protein
LAEAGEEMGGQMRSGPMLSRTALVVSAVLITAGIAEVGTTLPSAAAPQTWTNGSGDIPTQPIDCVDAGPQVDCAAPGDAYSTNAGITWTPSATQITNEAFAGTSCADVGTNVECAAVGGNVSAYAAYTTDGGNNWQTASLPTGVNSLQAVQCFPLNGTMSCAAASSDQLLYSNDGGATWTTTATVASNFSSADDLSCAFNGTDEDCVAFSFNPSGPGDDQTTFVAWYSGNGGATWVQASVPNISMGTGSFGSVSCVAAQGDVDCAGSSEAIQARMPTALSGCTRQTEGRRGHLPRGR